MREITLDQALEINRAFGDVITRVGDWWNTPSGTIDDAEVMRRADQRITDLSRNPEIMEIVKYEITRRGIKHDSKIVNVSGTPMLEHRPPQEQILLALSLGMPVEKLL